MSFFYLFKGLISKNQIIPGNKEMSGLILRDLWEKSANTANKPLAPITGLAVSRTIGGTNHKCLLFIEMMMELLMNM